MSAEDGGGCAPPGWSAAELAGAAVRELARVVGASRDHGEAVARGLRMLVELGALASDEVEPLGEVTRALEGERDDATAIALRVYDRFVLDGSTATAAALAGLASGFVSERGCGPAARLWGRTVIGAVTGAHVGRASGSVAVGAVAGAVAAGAAAGKRPGGSSDGQHQIALLLDAELGLSAGDAQSLADALGRAGAAGMALAIFVVEAIAQADAGGQPASIELGPADQAIVASALETAPSALPPDLIRLRNLLQALEPHRHR